MHVCIVLVLHNVGSPCVCTDEPMFVQWDKPEWYHAWALVRGTCASEVNACERGLCVCECEDGLQMAGLWRFMDEQWLCNVSVWDGRDRSVTSAPLLPHCDESVSRFALPGTPVDRPSLSSSLGHWEQEEKHFWQWLWMQYEINPPYSTASLQYLGVNFTVSLWSTSSLHS